MLREKNLLAHTEHSSMELLRAGLGAELAHALIEAICCTLPRASVAKIHDNTCLLALTLMKGIKI